MRPRWTSDSSHSRQTLWMWWMWENLLQEITLQWTWENSQRERNFMNGMDMGILSLERHTSMDIREFTQGRNPMNVMNVGKPPPWNCTSVHMREFIYKGKNILNTMNVGKLLPIIQPSGHIKEPITGVNCYEYNECGKTVSKASDICAHVRTHKGRNPMNAMNMGNLSPRNHMLVHIREFIQQRNPVNVM